MSKLKEVGGLGLRDPKTLAKCMIIQRIWQIWMFKSSLWVIWMRCRYVKGRSLVEIKSRLGNSPLWTSSLQLKSMIEKCINYASNYALTMVIPDFKSTLGVIVGRILPIETTD